MYEVRTLLLLAVNMRRPGGLYGVLLDQAMIENISVPEGV